MAVVPGEVGRLGPGVGLAVSAWLVLMAIMPEGVGLVWQGDGDADAVSFVVGVRLCHDVDGIGAGGEACSSISTSFSPLGLSSLSMLSSY